MNERIKELRIQALRWSGENVNRTLYSDYEIQLKEYEKFAELIVRECVGIVENLSPGYQDYRNQIEDAFRSDCIAEIKYRFGVEE